MDTPVVMWARVTRVDSQGAPWVEVPDLGAETEFGPCDVAGDPTGVSVGKRVLVATVGNVTEDVVILGGFGVNAADVRIPPGHMMPSARVALEDGWIPCDGRPLDRGAYSRLFAAIGTQYGAPSGQTFSVPDLRLRVPLGVDRTGADPYVGAMGRSDGLTLAERTAALEHEPTVDHRHPIEEQAAQTALETGNAGARAAGVTGDVTADPAPDETAEPSAGGTIKVVEDTSPGGSDNAATDDHTHELGGHTHDTAAVLAHKHSVPDRPAHDHGAHTGAVEALPPPDVPGPDPDPVDPLQRTPPHPWLTVEWVIKT